MKSMDTLKVILLEGGGTGYTWTYNENLVPESDRILELVKSKLVEFAGSDGWVYRAERHMYFEPKFEQFMSLTSPFVKKQNIQLIYAPAWEIDRMLLPDGSIDEQYVEE